MAINRPGNAVQYAAPSLQADKEVIMAAVKYHGLTLRFAAPSMADKLGVTAVFVQDRRRLELAAPSLHDDIEVYFSEPKTTKGETCERFVLQGVQ